MTLTSALPRPARVALQVTVCVAAVPEMVQAGSPFFLKCGLAASAVGADSADTNNSVMRSKTIRRMITPWVAPEMQILTEIPSTGISCADPAARHDAVSA